MNMEGAMRVVMESVKTEMWAMAERITETVTTEVEEKRERDLEDEGVSGVVGAVESGSPGAKVLMKILQTGWARMVQIGKNCQMRIFHVLAS